MTTQTTNCPYCGMIHQSTCPRIKAIEYHQDGTVKRVEFITPADSKPLQLGAMPQRDMTWWENNA